MCFKVINEGVLLQVDSLVRLHDDFSVSVGHADFLDHNPNLEDVGQR